MVQLVQVPYRPMNESGSSERGAGGNVWSVSACAQGRIGHTGLQCAQGRIGHTGLQWWLLQWYAACTVLVLKYRGDAEGRSPLE
jgi:hypothetical protein